MNDEVSPQNEVERLTAVELKKQEMTHVAQYTAAFYNELIRNGVPYQLAVSFTNNWLSTAMNLDNYNRAAGIDGDGWL